MTYLYNFVRWLPHVAKGDTFIVVAPMKTVKKLSGLGDLPNVQIETYPYVDTGGKARLYFDQVVIPGMIRRHDIDILFSSTGFGTFFSPCKQFILIRNPVYFNKDFQAKYKELGRSLRRTTIRRWHSALSIRRSDVILFPTRAMQDMVEQYVSLDGKQTDAIHYGFDHKAFLNGVEGTSETLEQVRKWKEEGYQLLLNVSTYAVHKNFETLIEALPGLVDKGLRFKLLTTTSREKTTDKEEYDALKQRAVELGVDSMWVELGYVPYQQLHVLYSNVDLYVFPSFTESFGHSLVEAMAAKLPILAADMPVNREVCEDAGAYFDIYNISDCTAKIYELICDNSKRVKQAEASAARSALFSWEKYTGRITNMFAQALAPETRTN